MSGPAHLVDRWWSMFEARNFDELASLVRPDAEIVMPGGMRFTGPAELRPVLEAYRNGFPDLRHEVVASVESARTIAIELRITMTHTGPFVTPLGTIPPTGRSVVLDACDVVRLDDDGRVRSWHTYFDQATLMQQIAGASPASVSS